MPGNQCILSLFVATLVAGCAGNGSERPPRPSVRAGEFGKPACFLRHTVHDFEVLNDRNLIIFAPGRSNAYHVQVSPPDDGLRFAEALAFQSSSSQICGYAGDSLITGGAGGGPGRLTITGVWRLDTAALEGLEGRFGKQTAPGSTAPTPGKGAEIEPLDPQPKD